MKVIVYILYIWYLNGIQIGHLNIQSKPYKCYKLDRNAGLRGHTQTMWTAMGGGGLVKCPLY